MIDGFASPPEPEACQKVWISSLDPRFAMVEDYWRCDLDERPTLYTFVKIGGDFWAVRDLSYGAENRCTGKERPPAAVVRELGFCTPWRPKGASRLAGEVTLKMLLGKQKATRSIKKADSGKGAADTSVRCRNRRGRAFTLDCSVHWVHGDYEWRGTASVVSRRTDKGLSDRYRVAYRLKKTSLRCLSRTSRAKCFVTHRGLHYNYRGF